MHRGHTPPPTNTRRKHSRPDVSPSVGQIPRSAAFPTAAGLNACLRLVLPYVMQARRLFTVLRISGVNIFAWAGSRHPGGDLDTRGEPQLVQDVDHVLGGGRFGDDQLGSDPAVAQSLGNQPGDFPLPRCEPASAPVMVTRSAPGRVACIAPRWLRAWPTG